MHPESEITYTISDSQSRMLLYHSIFKSKVSNLNIPETDIICIDEECNSDVNFSEYDISSLKTASSDDALIIYTSGTTGKPKGVLMTHNNINSQIDSLITAWKWTQDDKILHVLPLHHTHGLVNCLLCAIYSGATCEFVQFFDAKSVWNRMLTTPDITLFMAVPTIYSKLINEYSKMDSNTQSRIIKNLESCRLQVSGSAALPISVFNNWKRITGIHLLERYGMTEIGMALGNPLNGNRVPGTVGIPFKNIKCKIVNQDQEEITDCNVSGELWISGPQVFKEYWNRPKETRDAFNTTGQWFKTGDFAQKDINGYYKILGRASVDILKSGGYKISALDIERECLEHEKISDVAVVGIPSEEYGQIIGILVTLKADVSLELVELQEWLKPRLPLYKIPRRMLVLGQMPRNALGKVNKKELVKCFKMKT